MKGAVRTHLHRRTTFKRYTVSHPTRRACKESLSVNSGVSVGPVKTMVDKLYVCSSQTQNLVCQRPWQRLSS